MARSVSRGIAVDIAIGVAAIAVAGVFVAKSLLRPVPDRGGVELASADWAAASNGGTVLGEEGATLTIVEFIDYECPYCRAAESLFRGMPAGAESQVRRIIRHLPLEDVHRNAMNAAHAVVCAQPHGKIPEIHGAALARSTSDTITIEQWASYARSIGVSDSATFVGCMKDEATHAVIVADQNLAKSLGVTATPSFIVGGVFLENQSLASIRSRLMRQLHKK